MLNQFMQILRRCTTPVLVILATSVALTACAATLQSRPTATATAGSPASLLVLLPTQEAAAPAPTATPSNLAATRQPAANSSVQATGAPSATALLKMRDTEKPAATATQKARATKRPASTATPTAQPARRATATPDDGLPTIALSRLPQEARETIRLIERGGPFPYDKDGATFQNREGLLPKRPSGYYREYTVITPGSYDRGARRIVAGRGGELYYTADHYDSFKRVIP